MDQPTSMNFKNTQAFKDLENGKETQLQYYERCGSSAEIMKIVGLTPKPFGTACERMVTEMLQLEPRSSCQNDATFNGKNIEIKSARYWGGKNDCVWQHLEPDHDYEYVLFILVDFQDLNVWGIKKSHLMGELRDKKIVTHQGTQGWWTKKSCIISHLQPIRSVEELESFIN